MSTLSPLICVPPDQIDAVWPYVLGYLRAAYLACDDNMPENLQKWLKDKDGLLWIYTTGGRVLAAMVTSIERRPSGPVLRLGATGGIQLERWRDCQRRIIEYARAEGCVKIVVEGRPGWAKALREYGYTTQRVILEKVL
jgi:hypothetical protein